ncbi:hypothetical protein CFOLD11_32490 [Clostridium folliculivorans]|uniref:Prepilin-type N-terminal cleavage/methylation domain-containing protein n=1 Tax=Clostridium folliculivorans TaxID=2886038 RepID=A0A9W5Y4I4_9CLOT|nr:prepilin-type N-terminal cleavage/methylation domain-containing protein [Clostridium folliculivorans]GKU26422.1 hypothetical protein CFOLD11_32490 [Clostridium folliculivorans]
MTNALTSTLKKKKKGFTLIELIIVIAIIAIIAAIAVPNYTKVRNDSRVKADKESAETVKKITQTLLIDGTLSNSDGSVTLTFTNKALTSAVSGSKTLTDYYKDVKAPQEDGATTYAITISSTDGTVSVNNGKSVNTATP